MGNMMENMMGLVLTMWENNGTIMKTMGGFLWEFLDFLWKKMGIDMKPTGKHWNGLGMRWLP